ncbi:hypothetical protein IMG5_117510 [Ichthyophthirius multifiliis]|uniref:Uncharacterized protein n=1 Tax=Ichthyophthirius multifiliis TaxID=5932 RepID=G0QUI8_ICHMU|nr:hypothetical protein IMG5_117510 [Ichthyophthirius multifiliis]EGR31108.1 hypothetical protein IMG5_117510 [Ichthyophthirius multifiliis]|eukprot:XP_004034594.1 hypothetical protein IMG5_117510 [Ichthyophthirius multifiliis]
MKNQLAVPTFELALAIAHEYNIQDEYLKPATMPFVAMAKKAIDIDCNMDLRKSLEDSVGQFFANDTILFREDSELGDIQNKRLNNVIEYINKLLNISLEPTETFFTKELSEQEIQKIKKFIQEQDIWKLISIQQATINCKSSCLGISLINKYIGIQECFELARLEESYQINQYGLVEGFHDIDENTLRLNLATARLFNDLINF